MNTNGLNVGSKIYRMKGPVRHVGVVLTNGCILHITPNLGIELTDLNGFSRGHSVTRIPPPAGIDVRELERRAFELLENGPAYQWWAFNCEHLVSYVQTGRKVSNQLQAGFLGLAGYMILSKKPQLSGALLGVGVGLLAERALHSAKVA